MPVAFLAFDSGIPGDSAKAVHHTMSARLVVIGLRNAMLGAHGRRPGSGVLF